MILSKKRRVGIIIWLIAFVLSVALTLIIPNHYTSSIYTTLIFDVIAFISVFILWMKIFANVNTPSDIFYCSPAMVVSTVYLVIQFFLCVMEGVLVDVITFKITLILNIILMAIVWFLILSTIITRDHTQRVDSRQKNHHVEL